MMTLNTISYSMLKIVIKISQSCYVSSTVTPVNSNTITKQFNNIINIKKTKQKQLAYGYSCQIQVL